MDFLQPFLHNAINRSRKTKHNVQEELICRDELSKRTAPAPVKVKKKVHFESKPLIQRDESCCKRNSSDAQKKIQVKILMTKEDAARLLSKCKDGGILELRDAANFVSSSRKDY